ncbi:hypothetical protein PT974_08916 [Cladobotryum mycophilum]|uniref:F-box domain-containing protein n=1 Tax=Cladobotryum mycophilum TaxID=491253 RepID=A0ABR0SFP6_9HYPO
MASSSFWDWDSHWIGYTLRRCQKRIQSQCSPRNNSNGSSSSSNHHFFLPLLPGALFSSTSSSSSASSSSPSSTSTSTSTSLDSTNTTYNNNKTNNINNINNKSWRWPRRSKTMDLSNLPYTIFVEIISHLSPTDAIVCRRVSRGVHQALTRCDFSISLILTHFPRSLEGRLLRRYLGEDDHEALERGDWAAVFARLARRYFHLGNAMPWAARKVPVLRDERRLRGVTPWNRFLSLNGKTAPFHYWEPMWTFSAADGLLVFPAETAGGPEYRARDLATGLEFAVPFEMRDKVVRRVRLSHGILVFEWCEEAARYPLEDGELAYGQFATAYDVRRIGCSYDIIPKRNRGPAPTPPSWSFEFRTEWRIHLALGYQDRFFSAHNGTHYVLYFWQPTRSPWGGDPLEGIVLWEIGPPSTYRPSQDVSGIESSSSEPAISTTRKLRSITRSQLSQWGIRQGNAPSLRSIALDDCTRDPATDSACGHIFFTEEEHRWSAGPHSSSHPLACTT